MHNAHTHTRTHTHTHEHTHSSAAKAVSRLSLRPISCNRFSQTTSQTERAHTNTRAQSHLREVHSACAIFGHEWISSFITCIIQTKSSDWERAGGCRDMQMLFLQSHASTHARAHTHTHTQTHTQEYRGFRQSCPHDKRGSGPRAIQKGLQLDYREGNPISPPLSYTCFNRHTHTHKHTHTLSQPLLLFFFLSFFLFLLSACCIGITVHCSKIIRKNGFYIILAGCLLYNGSL